MHLKFCFVVTILTFGFANSQIQAQSFVGTSSGYVVADRDATMDEIRAGTGQWQQQVFTGTNVSSLNNLQSPLAVGEARAETTLGINRTASVSSGADMFYASSYWRDEITFTGGTGMFWASFNTELSGSISDSAGEYTLGGVDALNGAGLGQTAVRFREFIGDYDVPPGDPSTDTEFVLGLNDDRDYAFGPAFGYDFIDTFGYINGFGEIGPGIFGPLEDSGALNTGNRDELVYVSDNRSVLWEYGVPLPVSYLLETWAVDGGAVDFSNTGRLASIELPYGAQATSASGTVYNVINAVPEPTSNALVLLVLMVSVTYRRKHHFGAPCGA